MNELLICSWSGILILALMIGCKYRLTRPHLLWPTPLCIPAGIGAAACALVANNYLSRESSVSPHAAGFVAQAAGFIISAGLGEEFFKLAGGLLVLMAPGTGRAAMRDADRFLCMVTVALVFAVTENAWRLGDLGPWAVAGRGLLCVPMHMGLSGLQAVAVNICWRERGMSYLFAGYLLTVFFHAAYDIQLSLFPGLLPAAALAAEVAVLAWIEWMQIPEWAGLPLASGLAAPEVYVSRREARTGRLRARAVLRARLLKRQLS